MGKGSVMGAANEAATLYFEVHVTIDPVVERGKLDLLNWITNKHGYRLANLLMRKNLAPHGDDMFMTARGTQYTPTLQNMEALLRVLKAHGFKVRRYKIEDTLLDSARADELGAL
jgi:hypothetical protein